MSDLEAVKAARNTLAQEALARIKALEADLAAEKARADALAEKLAMRTGVPHDDRYVLVAWRWSKGVSFSVAHYWWHEDDLELRWKDEDGGLLCENHEVVGWWELEPFRDALAPTQEDNTDD
jgi:hypothetical protein